MSSSNKLDDYKKEIRSILIPYQKGCYLPEFNHAYRELIGRRLPSRELGFISDIEFLYSIPDVVRITLTHTGDYHLLGIADEKSKHIQKMVARQKPAKLKPPYLSRYFRPSRAWSYIVPPRFSEEKRPPEPERLPKTIPNDEQKLSTNVSPKEEVISLVQHFKNKLALDDLLPEYSKMYNKTLSLSKYGFDTVEECIDDIPELEIVCRHNIKFVRYCPESEDAADNDDTNELSSNGKNVQSYAESSVLIPPPQVPSVLDSDCSNQNSSNGNLPKSLQEKFQEVAKRFPEGIWASDFPAYFEEVTGQPLELIDLGYRCLSDLIDEAPSIFIRKPVAGSRKDYIIYPADNRKLQDNESVSGSSLVDHVVQNLRKILEAYPEGIKINQILHVYSINCKDYLHIADFGFDDLHSFLSSIKNRVPLKFDYIHGDHSIHLVKPTYNPPNSYLVPEAYNKEIIPFDAILPEFEYKAHSFPPNFDFTKFIPAYTSSVAHAGHLYLQLQEEDTEEADEYNKLGIDLDNFYNGIESEQYILKPVHIKVKASCVAKWPEDKHWYRAQILSIQSFQTVQVLYVDYGTRDIIPSSLLRYAKKEFIDLPVQAIRCRLAFLKPPNNAAKWDTGTRDRILQLCQDVPMMAKIEEIGANDIYSIILCDTNGDTDVFINDVLRNEGLADYDVPSPPNSCIPLSPEMKVQPPPQQHHNLSPLQALQAQYFLQSFATVAPSFAQNENYIKLLKEVSLYCQNPDPLHQIPSVPPVTPLVPPGFNTVPSSFNIAQNPDALFTTYTSTTPTLESNPGVIKKPKTNIIPPPVSTSNFFCSTPEYQPSTISKSVDASNIEDADGDNDIFYDDDDEMFQQFCQKISSNIRYVKRVVLGDGYKIHVIVVKSEPYASSGDISQLIWNNKEADYLLRRLQLKEVDIPTVTLSEDGNEELFQQLLRFNVKGVQKTTGFKSSVLLYPLKNVIKILNIFGHPSVTLRTRLTEEITNFNPNDPHWNEYTPDTIESDDEDSFSGVTDDDKIERLCLFDLLAMKESIMCKRKKMLSSSDLNNGSHVDEIDKLEQLHQKVLRRIQEIREICAVFG